MLESEVDCRPFLSRHASSAAFSPEQSLSPSARHSHNCVQSHSSFSDTFDVDVDDEAIDSICSVDSGAWMLSIGSPLVVSPPITAAKPADAIANAPRIMPPHMYTIF